MNFIPMLIGLPVLWALLILIMPSRKIRDVLVYIGAGLIMVLTLAFLADWMINGANLEMLYPETEMIDHLMLAGDILLLILIVVLSIKHKKLAPIVLAIAQTGILVYVETQVEFAAGPHVMIDGLSFLMCIIIAFIGGFICIYTVGYMKGYHNHHKDVKDQTTFFYCMLFCFLAAMFGLVLSQNLIWIYFFWEITSVISFLMIGYTRTDEAIHNSFRALWMNLLGGLGFAAAIAWMACMSGTVQLSETISEAALFPLICLALAGMTKSAQFPFASWLLGAMVAPTPSSALLHSATMVKAGVYLLIRLAPAMNGNIVGVMVSCLGGLTFIMASMMAIAQNDGKKVLAFSTISNLGLIVSCAGVGVEETVWGAIFLTIFHSVSKSMLFQSVGAVENCLGSRDIEDMHGLVLRIPKLAYIMGIGIAGMYLAPFGMLISKWVALKAFADTGNIFLVVCIVYGSATTMFYWTKWLTKLLAQHVTREKDVDVTRKDEYLSMFFHAFIMLALCITLPIVANQIVNPIVTHLFGHASEVLSTETLVTMAIMLVSVLVVPVTMFFIGRASRKSLVPIYMNGINKGDNRYFIDSFGEEKHLYLSNWYLRFDFGRRRFMIPTVIVSTAIWIICFCIVIGGAF